MPQGYLPPRHPHMFLDTCELQEIGRAHATGLIDGVTTNPTTLARMMREARLGATREELVRAICQNVSYLVSVQLVTRTAGAMAQEAQELFGIHPKVMVKIPMTVDGEGTKALAQLRRMDEEIRKQHRGYPPTWRPLYNVTNVFSAAQAFLAACLGADYVSPFFGRLIEETEQNFKESGLSAARAKKKSYENYRKTLELMPRIFRNYRFSTKLLAASLRTPELVEDALGAGYDALTIPPNVFWQLFYHSSSDRGFKKFLADWEAAQKQPLTAATT